MSEQATAAAERHKHEFGSPQVGRQTGPAEYEAFFDPCPCGLTWEAFLKGKASDFNAQNPGLELVLGAEPAEESELDKSAAANLRPFAELSDSGVLWAVNRALFHPRGYALAIRRDETGTATGWLLLGNGSEPWTYEPSVDEDRHFAEFEHTLRERAFASEPTGDSLDHAKPSEES